MKRIFGLILASTMTLTGIWSVAQNADSSGSSPARPTERGNPGLTNSDSSVSTRDSGEGPENGSELLSEVQVEDAPLEDVLRFLAAQADLNLTLDPQLMSGGEAGAPGRTVSMSLTNVTAMEALEKVVADHHLTLVPDLNTRTVLITPAPVDLASPSASSASLNLPPEEDPIEVLSIGAMPVLDSIGLLAESAKINFVIDPELLPPNPNHAQTNDLPAMKFYNTTYRQALDAILKNNNFVMLPDTNSHIARITRRPPPDLEPLITQVIQLKYANITNMTDLVQSTLSERSKVSADPRTSRLVVLATEEEMHGVTNLVAELDTPTRQVLIEAHLYETSKNPRSVKGIDWTGTLQNQSVTFGNGFTTGTTTTRSPGEGRTLTLPSGRTVEQRSRFSTETELTTTLGNGGLSLDTLRGFHPETAFLNADGLRAVLSFLNTEADTQVLATPRTTVLDNETAILEVTRAFPIFEITPGAATVPAGAQITYTNLGTILNVTPRIAANSNIALRIIPEVSNIDSVDTQVINGQQNTANIYAIRKIETQVTIPNSHTLVMGGLISDTTSKNYSKVPILGDIPVLGLLFRRDTKERSKANLLIFVTPTIVEDGDYTPASTDFLRQRPTEPKEMDKSAWNRGRPHDWSKPAGR